MTETAHFLDSDLREKVIEHLFVGDLLRSLWRRGIGDMDKGCFHRMSCRRRPAG